MFQPSASDQVSVRAWPAVIRQTSWLENGTTLEKGGFTGNIFSVGNHSEPMILVPLWKVSEQI